MGTLSAAFSLEIPLLTYNETLICASAREGCWMVAWAERGTAVPRGALETEQDKIIGASAGAQMDFGRTSTWGDAFALPLPSATAAGEQSPMSRPSFKIKRGESLHSLSPSLVSTGTAWVNPGLGGEPLRITDQPSSNPVWSPDGRFIAFTSLLEDLYCL